MPLQTTFADEARIAFDTFAGRIGGLTNPSLRLGVTGLSRAGKTVFITAWSDPARARCVSPGSGAKVRGGETSRSPGIRKRPGGNVDSARLSPLQARR